MRPLKAIRLKCLDCCCDQANEVKICEIKNCPLWPFRFGKNPKDETKEKKILSEEERIILRERLKKGREAKLYRQDINGR